MPFGAFLSGGVDSSAVVHYMSQILENPVNTFSIGFEDDNYNELNFARQAADICNSHHHEKIVRPDAGVILTGTGQTLRRALRRQFSHTDILRLSNGKTTRSYDFIR